MKMRWILALISGSLALTGGVWLFFHTFIRIESDYGPMHHSVEPVFLQAHGLIAMIALFAFGYHWARHVQRHWRSKRKRTSGATLVIGSAGLAISGYLLYYVGEPDLRAATSVIHWAGGFLLLVLILAHARPSLRVRPAQSSEKTS